jgi:hypothetical protein
MTSISQRLSAEFSTRGDQADDAVCSHFGAESGSVAGNPSFQRASVMMLALITVIHRNFLDFFVGDSTSSTPC